MANNHLVGKTILVVNVGSLKKKFILQRLKKLGLVIVCLNKEKNWAQPYVDHWILADNTNASEAIQAVKEFIANTPQVKINGAVTFWEDDVLLTSKIIDKFNFIGTPLNIAKKIRNKFLYREFCSANGLPAPQHALLKSIDDINNLPETLSYPLVIKPTFGSSSAYVIKIEDKEQLVETYKYIKKNISTNVESALGEGLDIFVEEYIVGDEVDIDIVLQNGKIKFYSISDNYQTREPFFVETGQSIPSSLSDRNKLELIAMAEENLEKLGVQHGIIHFEAKSTKDGPVPIEINLRMGGDEVHSFVKGAWNVDLIECAAKIALGIYIPKIIRQEMPRKYITGVYFLAEYSGVLSQLDINEEIRKKDYLEELHFFKKIGDPILVPPEGYEFLGWITVSGFSLPDAQDKLKEALKYVKYEVAKFTKESFIGKTLRKNSFSYASLNTSTIVRAAKIEKIKKIKREDQRSLHIGIAGNIYEDEDNPIEKHLTQLSKNIEKTLNERGYHTTLFNFNDIEKVFDELKSSDVDLVFNICERFNNSSLSKSYAAALLEALQISYTGSSSLTLGLCVDKIRVKKLLAFHNIPTPKWDYAYSVDDEISKDLGFPLIVKPANADDSFGINNESIVNNQEELEKQLKKVIVDLNSPALIEEYIDGDEYDVSILGSEDENDLRVLPLSRSIFKDMAAGEQHIYTHNMDCSSDALAKQGIVVQRPAKNINKKLETLITEIALDAYNILDCQDYGSIEIRVDKYDNPYILELNPNSSIDPEDYLPEVAKLTHLEYGDLLEEIISMAIKRYQKKKDNINN